MPILWLHPIRSHHEKPGGHSRTGSALASATKITMNKRPFLPGAEHRSRSIFFMLAALVGYCIWLWLLVRMGMVESDTSNLVSAALLLAPLLPITAFDLWLRLTWEPRLPML